MQGFPLLPFERMNEADVREEVLAPIIRILGYRTGTEFNVIREQGLRYSKLYLGRKNPSKDPELRGKADYILEIRDRVRWVLEAKAPCVDIAANDIEQAWSYANHPLIRNLPQPAGAGPTSAEISGPARQISADFTETASALALQWLISRNR